MQRYRRFTFIITMALLLLCFSAPAPSTVYADTPLLRVVAPATPQSTTEPVEVWVEIENATDMGGWELLLEYDHSLAFLTDIEISEFTGQIGSCTPTATRCALPLAPQEITPATAVGSYSYGNGAGGSGTGLLATLTFQPTGKTGQTPLHISSPRIADTEGNLLIPATQDSFLQFGVPTGVTLADFTVVPRPADLLVRWETASELNTLGFNLYRNTNSTAPGIQLNSQLIPSQSPGGGQGALYEWIDSSVLPNTTYYYWLEDVDMQGNRQLHGPISGTMGSPTAIQVASLNVTGETSPSAIQIIATLLLIGLTTLMVRWGWIHSRRSRLFVLGFFFCLLPTLLFISVTNAAPLSPSLPLEAPSGATAPPLGGSCFTQDLTCDQAVDEADLSLESQHWQCEAGEVCYEGRFDFDSDGAVTVGDLQLLAKEYDRIPPTITVTSPADSAVLASSSILVTGIVTDQHAITTLTVNGIAATVTGTQFEATVPLQGGNQTITVLAEDALGATASEMLIIKGDNAGPLVSVLAPAHRQSVYTLYPTIEIQYTDFLSAVDSNSLQVTLTEEGGSPSDITALLTIEANQAYGTLTEPLTMDRRYTLTVTIADTFGNTTEVASRFYVPTNPDSLPQPSVTEGHGWVTGVIYDSATCDEDLKGCEPLTGVAITAAVLNPENRNGYELYGSVISGPDGFFAFPINDTGTYALRLEKEGYTYGQREVNVSRGHSTATNAIYLTPFDTAVTPCDTNGCIHESADGQMRVIIPAGAIPNGQSLDVTATLFDRVNFLPGGELPPGTQETYAFNLSGESELEFTQPVTIQVRNYRGFAPGTLIPLGLWNPETLQWEHAGTGKIEPTGEWLIMEVMHFSMYDCNDPMSPPDPGADLEDETEEDEKCLIGSPGCLILPKSGIVQEWIDDLPTVNVLEQPVAPVLRYSTSRADPSAVIDIRLNINPDPTIIESFDPYIFYEVYIEGEKTDEFTLALDYDQPGEVGRYRYFWDGHNALGEPLPPGVYEFGVKVTFSFIGEYCYALYGIFGNPPDCEFGRTGTFQRATATEWITGTVELNGVLDNPYGAGWILEGQQQLFRDDAGHVLVADGEELTEYYTELGDALRGRGYYDVPQPPVSAPASVLPLIPSPPGGTFINADVMTDSTWTLAGSPYKIVGNDITVSNGVTLTIEPGVEVLVEKGRELAVEGSIQASGNATQPITMSLYVEETVDTFNPIGINLYGASALSVDSNGDLWYAGTEYTYNSGVELWHIASDGSQSEIAVPAEIQFAFMVYDLIHDSDDNLYLATNEGAARYDNGTSLWTVYRTDTSPLPANMVQAIAVTTDTLWVGTTDGAARLEISSGTWTLYTYEDGLASNNVLAIAIASDGTVWFGTDAGLSTRTSAGIWTTYDTNNSPILGNYVAEIAFDDEGDGWLAIGNDGISILSLSNTWHSYTPANSGLREGEVRAFLVSGAADKWFGHGSQGVSYLKANDSLWYGAGNSELAGNQVWDIARTPDGAVWLAHYGEGSLTQVRALPLTTPTVSGGYWDFTIGGGTQEDSSLRYLTIEGSGLDKPGGLTLYGTAPTIENVTIRASGGHGLYMEEGPPLTLTNLTVELSDENGIHLEDSTIIGTLTNLMEPEDDAHQFTNVTIRDNNGDAIYLDDDTPLELSDSTLLRNGGYGVYTGEAGERVTFLNSLLQENEVIARLKPDSDLAGAVWEGNKRNELEWTSGTLEGVTTWGPILGGIDTFRVVGNVQVEDGSLLTISPGTAVLFDSGGYLVVHGILRAVGEANNVVYFGPGGNSNWSGVQIGGGIIGNSNASHLRHLVVEGGQLSIYQTTPAIFDNITVHDAGFSGITLFDSPDVVVSDCNLVGNGSYAIYNETPATPITAINCYWGAESGPFHPTDNPEGTGQAVSDGVLFTPWRARALLMDRFRPVVRNNTAPDYSAMRYDFEGDLYTRYYPTGREVQFDTNGRHLRTIYPDGRTIIYQYNPDGTLATMAIVAPGQSDPHWTWHFAYTDGKLNSITDPAGRITTFTIDANGHLTAVTLPNGERRRFFYDERALLTQQEDRTGDITTYLYDDFGRLTTHISPPRAVTDPATGATVVAQEVRTFTPSDTAYLLNGTAVGDPDNPAPTPPRSDELVDLITFERGSHSGHTNAFGSWLDSTDGLGRTTTYEYDANNNLTRIIQPDGDCVAYTYDPNGNVLAEIAMEAAQCQPNPATPILNSAQQWTRTYEARFSRVKTETDPLGRTITYIYDYEIGMGDAGKIVRVELPMVDDGTGVVVTPMIHYTYNALGLVESKTDPRGTVTKYIYTQGIPAEAAGGATPYFRAGVTPIPGILVQEIEDFGDATHANLTTTFTELDGAGNPGVITEPGNEATTYLYDGLDRLISERDAVGVVTTYAYDGQGNLIEEVKDYSADGTTGRNVITRYSYNAENHLLQKQTIADGLTVQKNYAYDENGLLAATTDGMGFTTYYAYDAADQLISERDATNAVVYYDYTSDGRIRTITDEAGYIQQWNYDGLGRMVTAIQDVGALNLTTSYGYDLANNILTSTDAGGTTTCYSYDTHDRLITETTDCGGLNLIAQSRYDLNGNLLSESNWRGTVNRYTYDSLGRPTLTRWDDGGLNLELSQEYDSEGNLRQSTDPRGTATTYGYDALDRLVERCRDDGGIHQCTAFTYDRLGNTTTMTEPTGHLYRNNYNGFNQIIAQIADEGGSNTLTRYAYDNALNPISVTDPNGIVTTYGYSPRHELTLETFADDTTRYYSYDTRGNLATITQQDGTTITHTYDGESRLTNRAFSTGGSQTFLYDEMGRQTEAAQTIDGNLSLVQSTYNALGDLLEESQILNGDAYTVAYSYDYFQDIYTTQYPSGAVRVYTLDEVGRLAEVANESDAIATYGYNIPNGVSTISYANGVTTELTYDRLYRTTEVSSPLAAYRYGYDAADNVTFMQRLHQPNSPADVYQYDGLERVTQVWYGADATSPAAITDQEQIQQYELDGAGNRLAVRNDGDTDLYGPTNGTQLTDPMHRYQQVAGVAFAYDQHGNLTSDGSYTYAYDILHRQTGLTGNSVAATYLYDALGRRIAKSVTEDGNSTTTRYLYDKNYQVLEERLGDGTLLARYTYNAQLDEPITLEQGGTLYYYHRDALGNVTEMSTATGTLVERYEYDIYGQAAVYDGNNLPLLESAIGNPYLFTGRRLDPESGNYEYRNRIYHPLLGRFMQTDPLGTADGMNRYTYARTNPVTWVDPMGLKGKKAPGGGNTIKPVVPPVTKLPTVLNYTGPLGGQYAFTHIKFPVFNIRNKDKTIATEGEDPVTGRENPKPKAKNCCEKTIDQVTLNVTVQIYFRPGVSPEATSGYGRGTTQEDVNNGNTSLGFHEEQHVADVERYLKEKEPPLYVLPARKSPEGYYSCEDIKKATNKWRESLVEYFNDLDYYTFRQTDCAGSNNHRDCWADTLAADFKAPVPIKLPPKPKRRR